MSPDQTGAFCTMCGSRLAENNAYGLPGGHVLPGAQSGPYVLGRAIQDEACIRYAAMDQKTGTIVVVRELHPLSMVLRTGLDRHVTSGTEEAYRTAMAQYLEQGNKLMQLRNEGNMARILDCFTAEDTAFQVEERIPGPTLQMVVKENGPLSGGLLQRQMALLLYELEQLQRHQLVHGNITPDTLIWDPRDRLLKLTSMLACRDDPMAGVGPLPVRPYAPPEQFTRTGTQEKLDLYSLSAAMFFAVTGRDPASSLDRILEEMPWDLSGYPHPKPELETAIRRGMALRRTERPELWQLENSLRTQTWVRHNGTRSPLRVIPKDPLGTEYNLDHRGWPKPRHEKKNLTSMLRRLLRKKP